MMDDSNLQDIRGQAGPREGTEMIDNSPEFMAKLMEAFEERSKQEKADKVERYKRLNKMVRKGQILFCGSSLMEQFPINELLMDIGSPLVVYNRGIGGFTTEEMAEVLDTVVFELEPKYIFINIGTNDLNVPEYTLEGLMERYDSILSRIQEALPQAKLFLMAYYPVNPEIGLTIPLFGEVFQYRTNERIAEANRGAAELARKHGAEFLDVNAPITDAKGQMKKEYTIEGMHMYGDGYMKVLEALLPVLQNLQG